MNNSGISRRTLAKGAAWTAPAVAIAAAAPAIAASPGDCKYVPQVNAVDSCKKASADQYYLVFNVVAAPDSTGCKPPADCTAKALITELRYFGSKNTLWTGNAVGGTPITVCDAPNMGNKIDVKAQISCNGDTEPVWYEGIEMPQLKGCTSESFCGGTSTPAPAPTSTTGTPAPTPTEAPTATPTATAPVTPAPTQPSATTPAPSGTGSPTTKPGKP